MIPSHRGANQPLFSLVEPFLNEQRTVRVSVRSDLKSAETERGVVVDWIDNVWTGCVFLILLSILDG